jgi:TonB family protein
LRSEVELYGKQGISQGTALYSTLTSLTPGRKIIIAGTFELARNGTDYIRERSLTEAGSMTNPEFSFAFESISPAMDQDSSTASASAPAESATPTTEQVPSTIGVPSSVWDAARSSVLSAGSTSKRLPLPPDTTTDCDGPFYASYQGTSDFDPICKSEISTARAALRKAKLPCDALVLEWRDEPAQSPMMELECFVADNSTYGSSPVFYETGRGPFKGVTQDQWLHDLKCARGVHIPPGSPEYGEMAASCDSNTVAFNGSSNSAQDQKQAFVQTSVHSAPATGITPAPNLPGGEIVKPTPAQDFPNPSDYYPPESIRMREAGTPVVHVCVGPDGEASDEPAIVRSSGSARLDAGALQLAKAGHYNPGTEDAKPVTACINMSVKFQLRN